MGPLIPARFHILRQLQLFIWLRHSNIQTSDVSKETYVCELTSQIRLVDYLEGCKFGYLITLVFPSNHRNPRTRSYFYSPLITLMTTWQEHVRPVTLRLGRSMASTWGGTKIQSYVTLRGFSGGHSGTGRSFRYSNSAFPSVSFHRPYSSIT